MQKIIFILFSIFFMISCSQTPSNQKSSSTKAFISPAEIAGIINDLDVNEADKPRIEKSLGQMSNLWTEKDGNKDDFKALCLQYYAGSTKERQILFDRLCDSFDKVLGSAHAAYLHLREPVDQSNRELKNIDHIFSAYNPGAHFMEDMFNNKVAFITMLNFPNYSLEEKTNLSVNWYRQDWAYARMGEFFTARIPTELRQKEREISSKVDVYINNYNIVIGNLLTDDGRTPFPKNIKLISHWNLRDEIKSNYAKHTGSLEKQILLYEVMRRIVLQEIPQDIIDNEELEWNPVSNKVYKEGQEISFVAEPNTRYQYFLEVFNLQQQIDKFDNPGNTYIQRSFDLDMEMSKEDVEKIFVEFLRSPKVKQVAGLIKANLGRELYPFDIWYDGFKPRTEISQSDLTAITQRKYPDAQSLENDLPDLLLGLGFERQEAQRIASKIQVDPSRGAGHAWGASSIDEKSRLRTRIPDRGLDYKGFNIAMHEFGHNVEQTISLYDMGYYPLRGVPNTSFTEALAFIFQKRDLALLGIKDSNTDKELLLALDVFWNCYEIMGVSLVDMYVWDWLYANPNATAETLKNNVVRIAQQVWNEYYYPVLGEKDCPLLGIYSHMIAYPLYLSNYPMGHLIEFQIEEYLQGKDFAKEISRMYKIGKLTPHEWMKEAVGSEVSSKALLNAIH